MLETISELFQEAYKRNWITARDGNASIRWHDRDHFYVTPSGVRKQMLQPEMFKKMNLAGESLPYTDISTNLRPSGELPMHKVLQNVIDTEVRVVLHFHPTYTVAAMYAGVQLPDLLKEFPELSRYTSVAPNVPLLPPITEELATACVKNIGYHPITGKIKYNIVGMDRHGVVSVDTSPWRAFEHIERTEHVAKIVMTGRR